MAPAIVSIIARHQWRLLVRDRRIIILGAALVLMFIAATVTAAALYGARDRERQAAQLEETSIWESQGPTNPHGAAHFGRVAFKPVSPLSVIDPGLLPQLGTTLRLEAHANNPARSRAMDGGTALDRFGGLSPASMLQLFGPLLIVLCGFTAFAGEQARGLLRLELASGTAPAALMSGRLTGLGGAVTLLVAAMGIGGGLILLATGGGAEAAAALAAMIFAHWLYLLTFVGFTLAASAAFASARTALVILLAFWAMATLFVPRIAPSFAEAAAPTLSGPAFEALVTREVREGPSGHDPQDARLERLQQETMRRYGVTRMEDLPVSFNGISLFAGEQMSTEIYRRRFAELYDAYDRQRIIQRRFALFSPLQALRPLSAALAQSDQHAHRRFLEQSDAYRYELVQTLNRDIIRNGVVSEGPYLANPGAITRDMAFRPRPPGIEETLARHGDDLVLLVLWTAASIGLAFLAARRLRAAR